jgi:hypothetical protein
MSDHIDSSRPVVPELPTRPGEGAPPPPPAPSAVLIAAEQRMRDAHERERWARMLAHILRGDKHASLAAGGTGAYPTITDSTLGCGA